MSDNYYNDPRVSQSGLKTYLQCPGLYKAIYVDRSYQPPTTDTFTVGKAVDCLITQGRLAYNAQFEVVKRRSGEEGKIQLTGAMSANIEALAAKIKAQPVMETFSWMDNQTIIMTDKYKGMLDYFGIRRGIGYIADLKTTADLDKIHYTVEDYGYYFQMAYYRWLIKQAGIKGIKKFKCYIIAIDKTPKMKFGVYEVDQRRFRHEEKIIKATLKHLDQNPKFTKRLGKGVCQECPPEINCRWGKFTKKDIRKL